MAIYFGFSDHLLALPAFFMMMKFGW